MVNYEAITLGLEVEFESPVENGQIERGFVRYKGPINGKPGSWIGIEATRSVGYCDGRIMGRTYFSCADKFGLFLSADELRIAKNMQKRKKIVYKKSASQCDELLFKKIMPKEHLVTISEDYLKRAQSSFEMTSYADEFTRSSPNKFALRDTLVVVQKPKKKEKPKNTSFQPVASVQRSFMPADEMEVYAKTNWSYKNVSLPRDVANSSGSATFDGFNKKRANYIDPNPPR